MKKEPAYPARVSIIERSDAAGPSQSSESRKSDDPFDATTNWDKVSYGKLTRVIYEKSGITLGPTKLAMVSARVGKRMRALGIGLPRDYVRYMLEDESGDELVQLLDVISTNVTGFFRESDHFDFLAEAVDVWLKEGQRKFRFWSAASSTGEEPYSMAMTLLEAAGIRNVDIRILATDISTRVLKACKEGTYEAEKLAAIPGPLRNRYFEKHVEDKIVRYSAKMSLRELISFKRLNLSKPPFEMKGPFDAVFCRNVMIYFDNTARNNLIREIYRLLKPGGILMVGHSEGLTGMQVDLKMVKPSIYLKT
jgi:chemotaxis protein methyltransferase CheR